MDIEVKVPVSESGRYRVEEFTVTQQQADIENLRASIGAFSARPIDPGTYKRLMRDDVVLMSNTPAEIEDHWEMIHKSTGSVLINGLGLGVCLTAILEKDDVEDVTIIELSQDVIDLVGPIFADDSRVKIICIDAFEWKPPKGKKYDVVWHDIWDYITEDNLEDMHKLHRKYGKRAVWQGSWARYQCERARGR